jgi:N-acetylmuramoyl-L-alanine amidase
VRGEPRCYGALEVRGVGWRRLGALCCALTWWVLPGAASDDQPPSAPGLRTVVVDAGHGGADYGARANGVTEKDLALAVSRELARELRRRGLEVVLTRTRDEFVPLARRTEIANRARADLFLSIHANSAPRASTRGGETYFLSVEASDEEARRVALVENDVFEQEGAVPDSSDVVGQILGDLIRTEHLRGSSEIAAALQRRLAALDPPGRGVKQAPFVVLMGVNMPAALIEIGFLTHPAEARRLAGRAHQRALARALAQAVEDWGRMRVAAGQRQWSP